MNKAPTAPKTLPVAETAKPAVFAGEPHFERVIKLMEDLAVILDAEVELIKKQDTAAIGELLPKKIKLFLNLRDNQDALFKNADIMSSVPTEVKERTKAAAKKLNAALKRDLFALKGAVLAVRRIVFNVMGSIREEALAKNPSYGNPRVARMSASRQGQECRAVAVNWTA